MSKNKRSLDVIANEIHKFQRVNVFVVGDLLVEARDACEHGDWLDWLADHFDWSEDSAERYMKVARLSTQIPHLRNLKLAKTTLYTLLDEDEADLPVIIDALAKRATRKQLKPSDAKDVIEAAPLRKRFGDLPDQTLLALDNLPERCPWYDRAVTALKETQPTTEGAAEIVAGIQLAHVAELYAPHGKLPNIPTEELGSLENVPAEQRAKVLAHLLKVHQPVTGNDVFDAIYSSVPLGDGDTDHEPDDDASNDDTSTDDEPDDDARPSHPLPPELLEALKTVLRYAQQEIPARVEGITGSELQQITNYLQGMHSVMHGGQMAKIAADRAEARSQRAQGFDAS
jgi:Protein of unknown function (DUF3102)